MTIEFKSVSLLERIKSADTVDDLIKLIVEGSEYEYASSKTRGKWEKAAFTRKKELTTRVGNAKSGTKPRAKNDKKGVKQK